VEELETDFMEASAAELADAVILEGGGGGVSSTAVDVAGLQRAHLTHAFRSQ
jgi:hypothetical protein